MSRPSLPAEGYEMHALQLAREGRTRERKKGKLKREKGSLFRGGSPQGEREERGRAELDPAPRGAHPLKP